MSESGGVDPGRNLAGGSLLLKARLRSRAVSQGCHRKVLVRSGSKRFAGNARLDQIGGDWQHC
jgi:hypothetical protein